MRLGVEAVGIVDLVLALEDQVIDLRIAVLAPVAATYTRVEQGAAQAFVGGTACQEVAGGLEAVLARRGTGLGLEPAFHGRLVGDGAGHEVDDAAYVLRAITHGTATADYVHGVHVAHTDWRERQLWLTVGSKGHRDAVHQDCGAGRQARIEPADAEVHGHVMAAGTVVLRGIDAGNAVEHLARAGGACAFEIFTPHHVSGAGMLEHVGLLGGAEPVAHDTGRAQFKGGTGTAGLRHGDRFQRVGAVPQRAGLQPGPFEQYRQCLFHGVGALQPWAWLICRRCRTE